jgi:pimeloyl-ACP methyl ester carboxylesterase
LVTHIEPSLYPFVSQWFDRGSGQRMHYVDEGPAQPAGIVVFVHGNPTWSFYYRNLIMALRDTHRCIAVDHIGMGLSDKPDAAAYPYTLAARVDDLTRLLANVLPPGQTGDVTLVVHDWGGMIGLSWAVRHLIRLRRVVLLNTAAFGLPASKKLPWQLGLTRSALGTLLVRGGNAFALGATYTCMTRTAMPAAVRQAYLAPYNNWANRIATLRFVQDIPLQAGDPGFAIVSATADQLGQLAQIPVQIWWGGKDFVFDDHFLAEWRRRLPSAGVRYLADAGHYVLEDAAAEIVPEIVAFVQDGTVPAGLVPLPAG